MSEYEIGPPERRKGYTEIKHTLEDEVAVIEACFQRWLTRGLIAFSVIGTMCVLSLIGFGLILHNQSQTDVEVKQIAVRAEKRTEALLIGNVLDKEKICSVSSNQKETCGALFDRLDRALSHDQRVRFACIVLRNVDGPTADALRKENPKCQR